VNVILIDHEAEQPKSNFRLIRLCEWAGFNYGDFQHVTIRYDNPRPWEAIGGSNVLLPMGPRATDSFGIPGGVNFGRGYVYQRGMGSSLSHLIPTVAPGFIQRGNAKYSAAFINDLQKAVHLSREGLPAEFTNYLLDPTPLQAYEWALEYRRYLSANPSTYLAFDIETPGKGEDEEDADTDSDAPDRTWHIDRIGFSYRPYHALSIPWEPVHMATIRLLMEGNGSKVVWNAGFDVPRVRREGVAIEGTIHDGMVAWHILHTDLPKRLGFVATFTCPWQPAWKHLSGAKPAFYNATDADVELRSMLKIEDELRRTGMWDVYQKDVLDLEPILDHMHHRGMPIDFGVRLDRAVKLAERLKTTRSEMEQCVPLEARRIAIVYKKTPKDITGLYGRDSTAVVPTCTGCGLRRPGKAHFKRFKKKLNPCAESSVAETIEPTIEYFRLSDFTPSRDQLVRYHEHLKRPCPRTYDKKSRTQKISFAEKQLKELLLKYPSDPLYGKILEYRALDKLAGTYIGRPIEP
jgi:hypothetical protein